MYNKNEITINCLQNVEYIKGIFKETKTRKKTSVTSQFKLDLAQKNFNLPRVISENYGRSIYRVT